MARIGNMRISRKPGGHYSVTVEGAEIGDLIPVDGIDFDFSDEAFGAAVSIKFAPGALNVHLDNERPRAGS